MIIGVGTDIVNIDRIEDSISKFGDSFIKKCFTPAEISESESKPDRVAFFSKRFAAKEAFYKALGTGFTNGVSWQDVEISNDELGKPEIKIQGTSKELLQKLSKNAKVHISLSDDKPFTIAFVIIEERK